jgi:NAD(P)-dependent dehydrogenase (short-subunit alcohol dehydrogenase family)
MQRLDGKVAVVTGAGSGNGRAIALGFAREGARVLVADVDEAAAEATAGLAREQGWGDQVAVCPVDVADGASVRAMVEEAEGRFGRIDVLVSNAGITNRQEFLDLTEELFDRVIAVNLRGVFLCGLYCGRRMAATGGGAIINIASVNSEVAASNTAPYCASKGGVQMLTRSMAVSLAPHKIRVNAIGPGTIRTNINRDRLDRPGATEAEAKRVPLGRLGTPEDLVGPAVFLASNESTYVTGHTLFVDGGFLITWNPEHALAPMLNSES